MEKRTLPVERLEPGFARLIRGNLHLFVRAKIRNRQLLHFGPELGGQTRLENYAEWELTWQRPGFHSEYPIHVGLQKLDELLEVWDLQGTPVEWAEAFLREVENGKA